MDYEALAADQKVLKQIYEIMDRDVDRYEKYDALDVLRWQTVNTHPYRGSADVLMDISRAEWDCLSNYKEM